MKIDWKYLATTPGYISLKKCLTDDLQGKWCTARDKREAYKTFRAVIGRATSYAHHQQRPIAHILNEWETGRTYNWLNYYNNSNKSLTKLVSKRILKPKGIKGLRKYYKKWHSDNVKNRMCKLINEKNLAKSTRTKKRWTTRMKYYRSRQLGL